MKQCECSDKHNVWTGVVICSQCGGKKIEIPQRKEQSANRIDEIKERLDKVTHLRGNKGFDAREEFESCAEADIDYLLSLNERYKQALKELADPNNWDKTTWVPLWSEPADIAKKALEE